MLHNFLRKHPFWSIAIGFVLLSVIIGPFLPENDASDAVAVDDMADLVPERAEPASPTVDLTELQDSYLIVLVGGGLDSAIITDVYVLDERTVQVAVSDAWHYQPKQIRTQLAQRMWAAWASVASPSDSDRARIKLVDQLGNNVGGSGWLGGSMISVID